MNGTSLDPGWVVIGWPLAAIVVVVLGFVLGSRRPWLLAVLACPLLSVGWWTASWGFTFWKESGLGLLVGGFEIALGILMLAGGAALLIRAYFSPARGLVPFALLAALVGIAVLRHRDSEVQDAAARQQLDSARQYLFAHRDELKSRDDCQWVPDFVRAGCLATLPAASPEQARENGRYWAQDQRHRVENARDCTQGPNRRAEFVAGCEEEVARRRQAAQ